MLIQVKEARPRDSGVMFVLADALLGFQNEMSL